MVRPPWSRRRTEADVEEFFVVREGVPDGLFMSLLDVVTRWFYVKDDFHGDPIPDQGAINRFARLTDKYLPPRPEGAAELFHEDRGLLLDAVDFTLGELEPDPYGADDFIATLNGHLLEARSAYTLGVASEPHTAEKRLRAEGGRWAPPSRRS